MPFQDHNLELSTILGASIDRTVVESVFADGFALVTTPGMAEASLKEIFDAGRTFFQRDRAEKTLNRLPNDCGYRPHGVEYSQSPSRPDEVESFSLCRPSDVTNLANFSASGANLYEKMAKLFNMAELIAEKLAVRLAAELTGTSYERRFSGAFRRFSLLQLNYSQPSRIGAEYINEVHEDGSLVTIISVTGPGLELQRQDGSFVSVTPLVDKLLLMSGEILWLLSGGRIPPVHHRVRPVTCLDERMSLLFFADLNPDLCEPWVANDVNANIDIGERVRKNPLRFGLSEWESSS
jgi:isopenicillin N synthase-like dioxygenase